MLNFLTNNLSIMKKLGKLQINPNRLMKNEELMTLRGGYGSYLCHAREISGICSGFITGINTVSCSMALEICREVYFGDCVNGGDC